MFNLLDTILSLTLIALGSAGLVFLLRSPHPLGLTGYLAAGASGVLIGCGLRLLATVNVGD